MSRSYHGSLQADSQRCEPSMLSPRVVSGCPAYLTGREHQRPVDKFLLDAIREARRIIDLKYGLLLVYGI